MNIKIKYNEKIMTKIRNAIFFNYKIIYYKGI